jgi:hypothetical protein
MFAVDSALLRSSPVQRGRRADARRSGIARNSVIEEFDRPNLPREPRLECGEHSIKKSVYEEKGDREETAGTEGARKEGRRADLSRRMPLRAHPLRG